MNQIQSMPRQFNILLVEDNDDDVLLTRHAFKKLPWAVQFQTAGNGLEALRLLRESSRGNAPLPDLILLDLNMPCMDGRQLLLELKSDDRFQAIPAIVLSTSAAPDDVLYAYHRHASAYMIKPIALQQFIDAMQGFAAFWVSGVALFPSDCRIRTGCSAD